MAEQVLDDMKWMLDFSAHTCLEMLKLFGHPAQLVLRQRLTFGALHGHVPSHRFADVLGSLFDALIARVAKGCHFIAVQQRVRLRHIGGWLASTILAGRRQLSWPVKRSVVNPSFPSFSA